MKSYSCCWGTQAKETGYNVGRCKCHAYGERQLTSNSSRRGYPHSGKLHLGQTLQFTPVPCFSENEKPSWRRAPTFASALEFGGGTSGRCRCETLLACKLGSVGLHTRTPQYRTAEYPIQ